MRHPFRAAVAVAAVGLATAAAMSAGRPAAPEIGPETLKALDGRTRGRTLGCIPLGTIRSSEIVDREAIIYKQSARRWFVNMPPGGCPPLRRGRTLVTQTSSSQLCSGDIVRIVDPPTPIDLGACGLGGFVEYTR